MYVCHSLIYRNGKIKIGDMLVKVRPYVVGHSLIYRNGKIEMRNMLVKVCPYVVVCMHAYIYIYIYTLS
jgi:hypothetical protein